MSHLVHVYSVALSEPLHCCSRLSTRMTNSQSEHLRKTANDTHLSQKEGSGSCYSCIIQDSDDRLPILIRFSTVDRFAMLSFAKKIQLPEDASTDPLSPARLSRRR